MIHVPAQLEPAHSITTSTVSASELTTCPHSLKIRLRGGKIFLIFKIEYAAEFVELTKLVAKRDLNLDSQSESSWSGV